MTVSYSAFGGSKNTSSTDGGIVWTRGDNKHYISTSLHVGGLVIILVATTTISVACDIMVCGIISIK